jgi:transcriptional regulator with XRE-family HTH domain
MVKMEKYAKIDIGKRLKELRNKRGLSANALAKEINLDPTTIYKIEAGAAKPSFDALERICDALGSTMSEFFSTEHDVPSIIDHAEKMNLNDEQKAALEDYKKMPPDEQQRRLSIVLDKIKNLPVADQEALFRIINSLSSR